MRKLKNLLRTTFDVREGERLRTLFMALYLLAVLFAYYILKPAAKAMFLTRFKIDEVPYLYILIAIVGGLLATVYTKMAVRVSLRAAVAWATAIAVVSLVAFWQLVQLQLPWMIYVFNVWASLFGIVLVSQGWLVAANVFSTREAKRVYGLVGLGAVVGGWTGSAFTTFTVKLVGIENLLLASALLVVLAYVSFRLVIAQKNVSLAEARAAEAKKESFSSRDIFVAIRRHRHLQVITAIITLTFIVDVMVEFQWLARADRTYSGGPELAAFMSTYYLIQNIVTFVLQFVMTGVIVRTLGVGGTLRLMPSAITVASLGSFFLPGLMSASAARLTEAASRYTFNRTGMELLYLPLPTDLRNRTKAFVDIFVDRMGRGVGGMLLILLGWLGLRELGTLPWIVIGFAVVWVLLSMRAQREYIRTVRTRLEARRLDLEGARVTAGDPATLALLEQAARSGNARQACYALSLLTEVPGYTLEPLLVELAASSSGEVRAKVYELARSAPSPALLDLALEQIRSSRPSESPATVKATVGYALAVSREVQPLAREFLEHANPSVMEGVLEAMREEPEAAQELVTREWLSRLASAPEPDRRRLAAVAIGACGDQGTEALHRLLEDSDTRVAAAACEAAGNLRNRAYLNALLPRLADSHLRGAVIESLAAYGTRISGTLSDLLEDESVPVAIRRQVPRVLKSVPDQRSVDVLLRSINQPDLSVRAAVLKALNRLRETAATLDYGNIFVTKQILNEARLYFQLNAALAPFRDQKSPRTAAGLLAASIEERLRQTLERLFRLLGLRYPPKEIYAAYLAVHHRRKDQFAAALEFLDNVLDRELKRILLPLLDEPGNLMERGRDLFGVEVRSPEEAIRTLIRSGDSWLVSCAMAAAAELKLRSLVPDITQAARDAGADVGRVALAAQAALA
jgi:AAA family ATP:ADP antiporter